MRYPIAVVFFLISPFTALADGEDSGAPEEGGTGYVERTEEVKDSASGRVRVERVVEFDELQIEPTLARPVSFILPRAKPDFDAIHLTIYNNEPPACVPEEIKANYYRRVIVDETKVDEKTTEALFTPTTKPQDDKKETAPGDDD